MQRLRTTPRFTFASPERPRVLPGLRRIGLLLALLLASSLLLSAGATRAASLEVGSTLAPLSLEDQHGQRREVGETTRVVLFTRDMDGGALVKAQLAKDGASQLAARDAVYVADVSAMPALVRRLFALPKLRERPYPILLDTSGTVTRDLPATPGHVTLLRLDHLRVTGVEALGSEAELRAAWERALPTP